MADEMRQEGAETGETPSQRDHVEAFVVKEYELLRAEMLEAVRETRTLERYALAVTGAIWTWLATNPSDQLAWWAPVVLVAFLYLRAWALKRHIDGIAAYLIKVERRLAPSDHTSFEAWFAESAERGFKKTTVYVFWTGLLIATVVVALFAGGWMRQP